MLCQVTYFVLDSAIRLSVCLSWMDVYTAARWLLCLTGIGSFAQAHSVGLPLYYCFINSIGFHCICR